MQKLHAKQPENVSWFHHEVVPVFQFHSMVLNGQPVPILGLDAPGATGATPKLLPRLTLTRPLPEVHAVSLGSQDSHKAGFCCNHSPQWCKKAVHKHIYSVYVYKYRTTISEIYRGQIKHACACIMFAYPLPHQAVFGWCPLPSTVPRSSPMGTCMSHKICKSRVA